MVLQWKYYLVISRSLPCVVTVQISDFSFVYLVGFGMRSDFVHRDRRKNEYDVVRLASEFPTLSYRFRGRVPMTVDSCTSGSGRRLE